MNNQEQQTNSTPAPPVKPVRPVNTDQKAKINKPGEDIMYNIVILGIGLSVICIIGYFFLGWNKDLKINIPINGDTIKKIISYASSKTTATMPIPGTTTTPKPGTAATGTGVIIGTDVNVRTGASMQSKVIDTFGFGENVTVIEVQGEWAKVRRANGVECYVAKKYLGTREDFNRKTGKQIATAPNIPSGAKMVAYHSSADQEGSYIHSGSLAVDGNVKSCWSEGVKGLGVGENIEIQFNDTYRVNGMNIWIGHQKTRELFYQNARPTAIRVAGSDGSSEVYRLNDTFGGQRVPFKYPITVSKLYLVVEQVARGSTYEDTCIAEVNFF